MNKAASEFSWAKLATYLIPVVAVLAAIFLIFLQVTRLRALQEQRTKIEQQIAFLDHISQEIKTQPPLRKVAAVPPAPDEQSQFLNMVRDFADKSRVRLVRYTNRFVAPPAADSPEAKKNALPPGVMAMTSDVEVVGDYNGIRAFLYQLLRAPRLYNTTDLKWNRGGSSEKWPLTRLKFTLLRYIAVPIPPPTKPDGSAASPPANS